MCATRTIACRVIRGCGNVWLLLAMALTGACATEPHVGNKCMRDIRHDVAYGTHPRQTYDLWLAQGRQPTPLVVYIHGGGGREGDKTDVEPFFVQTFLAQGISVASVNYRLTAESCYPTPMLDVAAAVEQIKARAPLWGVDPDRIALYGSSFGGTIALWIAFTDGDGRSMPMGWKPPRVSCVAAIDAPTSLNVWDIHRWLGARSDLSRAILPLFGVKTVQELASQDKISLMDEASPLVLVSRLAPPVFLYYYNRNVSPRENLTTTQYLHHPVFGIRLKAEMDQIGVEAVLRYPEYRRDSYYDVYDFVIRKLAPRPGLQTPLYAERREEP